MSLGTDINNPFDLRAGTPWKGVIGERNGFAMFNTLENGLRAGMVDLHVAWKRDGLNSIDAIVRKYAPPSENETTTYINGVCSFTGWGRYDPLDLDNVASLSLIGSAFLRQEQGADYIVDGATLQQAAESALA